MNKRQLLLGMIFSLPILVISFRSAYALFSSSSSNENNTFSAAAIFPTGVVSVTPSPTATPTSAPTSTPTATPTPTSAPQIVINEISSNGNNQNDWAELYNPSGVSVDLSGWLIGNGALNDALPAGSIIAANGYAVIITGNSSVSGIPVTAATFQLTVNQIGNGFNAAGDVIVLKNTAAVTIDQLSYGTDTTVFPTPPAAPGSGQSLSRSPNGSDTDAAIDWVIDSTPSIGVAN